MGNGMNKVKMQIMLDFKEIKFYLNPFSGPTWPLRWQLPRLKGHQPIDDAQDYAHLSHSR